MPDAGFLSSEVGNFASVDISLLTGEAQMAFKVPDSPIYKTFSYGVTGGALGGSVVQTIEWEWTYGGVSTSHIQAPSDRPLLVSMYYVTSGSFPPTFKVWRSNSLDTEDGTALSGFLGTSTANTATPFVVILDKSQYLTVNKLNDASAIRGITFSGFTVELPTDFVV